MIRMFYREGKNPNPNLNNLQLVSLDAICAETVEWMCNCYTIGILWMIGRLQLWI